MASGMGGKVGRSSCWRVAVVCPYERASFSIWRTASPCWSASCSCAAYASSYDGPGPLDLCDGASGLRPSKPPGFSTSNPSITPRASADGVGISRRTSRNTCAAPCIASPAPRLINPNRNAALAISLLHTPHSAAPSPSQSTRGTCRFKSSPIFSITFAARTSFSPNRCDSSGSAPSTIPNNSSCEYPAKSVTA
ncbi:hypothetical protein [Streptomyces oceani]|uniref:hypothetical protein n=1 Tax=Streptomyces oceani TaxID=1075402 RepID=UPI001112F1B3|nr:hypothetical protein [Streptomyces oceani]